MKLKRKRNTFDRYAVRFLLPAFLLYTGFVIWPSITSLYYSLTNWNGVSPDITFVGFLNFKTILTSDRFWNALKNTFILTFVISIFENAIALALALLVDKVTVGKTPFVRRFTFRSCSAALCPGTFGKSYIITILAPSTNFWMQLTLGLLSRTGWATTNWRLFLSRWCSSGKAQATIW